MRRSGAVLAAVLAMTLVAAGCGGSADQEGERPFLDTRSGGGPQDGGGGGDDARDAPGQPGEDAAVAPDGGPCVGPGGYTCDDPPATPPHAVDGYFTGWLVECPHATHEWTCKPRMSGESAHAYFDGADGVLHVMNDWFRNDRGPIDETCACRFRGFTDDGAVRWHVYVYGDQTVLGTRNGAPVDLAAVPGATGFGRSPLVPGRDHSLCEVALPAQPGAFGIALLAPLGADPCLPGQPCGGDGSGGSGDVVEELYITGVVTADGTVEDVTAESGPALLEIDPPRAPIGAIVSLIGLGFGATPDRTVFNGRDASVLSWTDQLIRAQVPSEARSGPVRVGARTRWSNPLPFEVTCEPDCLGRNCGSDGCGGFCGDCELGWSCEEGVCVCHPDCFPWWCGEDFCGGRCECAAGLECDDGNDRCREPCAPSCSGRVCGPDGCGGSCGLCPGGWYCEDERFCVEACFGSCYGRECGDDGCGNSCGACTGEGARCVAGHCECEPSCEGRACGDDGCGGSCGACPDGHVCRTGECICIPQCAGGACGPDGCGGTCRECAGGAIQCVDGRCVCVPDCDGRVCGDDDCGGSCGLCTGAQEACREGQCVCLPVCGSRQCGDDGCSGTCGDCPPGVECDKDGRCAAAP